MRFVLRFASLCILIPILQLCSCAGGTNASVNNTTPTAPTGPATTPATLTYSITGPMETVYDYASQACDQGDFPDDAARAFRDYQGTVHMIASVQVNRAMLGTDLNHLTRSCDVTYADGNNADPMLYDDWGWMETYYTTDGKTVHSIIALDYHPSRHNITCGTTSSTKNDCWYGSDIAATSTDGGYTFTSPPPGEPRMISASEYIFDANYTATQGTFVPTNIINWGGYYYFVLSVVGRGVQPTGDCVMRTTNLADPSSWRAWDGAGYNMRFLDPATNNVNPAQHVCTVVSPAYLFSPMRNLLVLPSGQGFLGTLFKQVTNTDGSKNFNAYGTTSIDLVNWTTPVLIISLPLSPGQTQSWYYPSIIDPSSSSRNFETITGNTAYIYFTHFVPNSIARDLVRFPLTINGLQ